jgi:hypothetical protein
LTYRLEPESLTPVASTASARRASCSRRSCGARAGAEAGLSVPWRRLSLGRNKSRTSQLSRLVIAMLAAALALGVAGFGGGESQAEPTDSVPSSTTTSTPPSEVEGGAKKKQYESRVCDIMVLAEYAWATDQEEQVFAELADELGSISAPADVEGFHKSLASELNEFSETLGSHEALEHVNKWQRALSEIRASGYNVKPGWGTCPAA